MSTLPKEDCTNYRTTDQELRYFGSDLNKWIGKECSKDMTAINLDLILYKRVLKKIRIIESKHIGEDIPWSQREILTIFAKIFRPLLIGTNWIRKQLQPSLQDYELYQLDVYIVEADYPYTNAEITDISTDKIYQLSNGKFKEWIEFKYKLQKSDELTSPF